MEEEEAANPDGRRSVAHRPLMLCFADLKALSGPGQQSALPQRALGGSVVLGSTTCSPLSRAISVEKEKVKSEALRKSTR